jgi:hypothetical protein
MAATGVLKRKFWRACLTASPDWLRYAAQQFQLDAGIGRIGLVHVVVAIRALVDGRRMNRPSSTVLI